MAFDSCNNIAIEGGTFNAVEGNQISTANYYEQYTADRRNPFDILSYSASLNATHTSEQRFPPPKCHPETREQILQTLSTWILAKKRSRIMWVYGTVGVGKSAIAQTLCEKFADSRLAASFFFSRTDPSRNHVDRFVATIAHQLATAKSFFIRYWARRAIRAAMKHDQDIFRRSATESTFRNLVLGPYMTIPRVFQAYTPNVVIVDGLDECLHIPSQERLLTLLWTATTSRHPCPFDFVIFSRPEPHITDFFDRISKGSWTVNRLCIGDSFQTDRDMETFLLSRFREILAKHHRAMQDVPDSWPGPNIVSQLVQRACGQFVYATTVTKYIDTRDALPTKRLDDILSARPAKPSPYGELDLLYQQILRSCHDIAAVLQILQLVLGSSSGIPANVPWLIAQILEVDEAMIPVLMIGLHSVLQVPSSSRERIVIFHASFSEFLRDPERSREFSVAPLPDNVRIKAYFILKFERLRSRRARQLPQSWPGKIALEACVQRAGGETLYADILLDYLEGDPDGRLDTVLSLQPQQTSPTAEMDLLCQEIVRGCGDVALCILQLVLATSPELPTNTPRFVAQALDIDYDAVTGYLAQLRPIAHIPSTTDDPILIRHSSILDFLRSPERAQQFYVAPLSPLDIQAQIYLRKAVASLRTEHKLLQSWPGEAAFQSILRKSGGELSYLKTLIRYISDTDNPAERLAKVLYSDGQLDTALSLQPQQSSPTAEMDLLCQTIFRECGDVQVALRILQVVLATSPELPTNTPRFVAHALDIDYDAVTDYLAQLGPVVHIPSAGTNNPILIRHSTISDFLLSPERAQEFYITPLSKDQMFVLYLKTLIATVRMRHELPQSWPGQSAFQLILEKSGGCHAYVNTLTRYLDANPFQRLTKVLNSELDQHERSPEFELYTLYRLVLDSCHASHGIRQLLLLIREYSPRVSITFLSRALEMDITSISRILVKLWPICRVVDDNRDTMVSFWHPSFSDFLLDVEHAGPYATPLSPDETVKASLCYHLEKHWPGNIAVNWLVQMACGQEIYVQTLIRYIRPQSNPLRVLLDIVNEGRGNSPQSPTNPNHHLDRLYHGVLCKVDFASEDRYVVLQGFLRAIKYDRHIVLRVLLMAIKYDREKSAAISDFIRNHLRGNDSLYYTLRSLHPILDFSLDPERPCPIRFHHPSFPEFLLDEERSKEFYVGPGSLVNKDVEQLIQAEHARQVHITLSRNPNPIHLLLLRPLKNR